MKLLIVEDEKMTREGLQKSLNWGAIGISGVFAAESGEIGLAMAKRISPDIVLTDIRMPRMDGITMAGRIRELFPDCRIIFLSAYSEIEYYKAAMDLKAVRYLDKPVDAEQLQAVLSGAVKELQQLSRYKSSSELQKVQEKMKLANAFCTGERSETWKEALGELNLSARIKGGEAFVTAVVVKVRSDFAEEHLDTYTELAALLSGAAGFPNIYTVRGNSRIILFLLTAELTIAQLETVGKKLQAALQEKQAIVVFGKPVRDVENSHRAYQTAKIAELNAYCYSWGEIVWHKENSPVMADPAQYAAEKNAVLTMLSDLREQEAQAQAQRLYDKLKEKKNLEYDLARELYFEIISAVYRGAENQHLRLESDELVKGVSWMAQAENCILDELHAFLTKRITLFFKAIDETRDEKRQILAIKDYIAAHFADDTLSISDISAFLNMSASHICTMFKKETGDTINNYLTDYRLKKAQQYLSETLLSVSDVSTKVGYKDNSYFGRLFRKRFGVTPNEYRNR